jgi:predicted metal-dependent hydrolase
MIFVEIDPRKGTFEVTSNEDLDDREVNEALSAVAKKILSKQWRRT